MNDAAERFPWREAMAFGLGRLRLPSGAFWSLTRANWPLPSKGSAERSLRPSIARG